jgi:hypothetical protein
LINQSLKFFVLKRNKHKFPTVLSTFLTLNSGYQRTQLGIELKLWYKKSFQKGNRWNQTLIRKQTVHYTVIELSQLVVGFRILFNQERKYNQIFLNYLTHIIEEKTAEEEGLIEPRIKISQKDYIELLHIMGDLKASGEIQNSYRELANIVYRAFAPETELRPSTIFDRLKNQKGYK